MANISIWYSFCQIPKKDTQINITMVYNFSPIRFEKYEKIDTAVDITSIVVISVVPIKDEKYTYPLV